MQYPRRYGLISRGAALAFKYSREEQILEFALYPRSSNYFDNKELNLLPSADFDILDSITYFDRNYFRFRIRFKGISRTDVSQIGLRIASTEGTKNYPLKLLPYAHTKASFNPGDDFLYIGEEKQFEIYTKQVDNLVLDGLWKTEGDLGYRLFERNGAAFIALLPLAVGSKSFEFAFNTRRPALIKGFFLSHYVPAQIII